MTHLLDTNVVSELRRISAARAERRVTAWAHRTSITTMYLSVISLLELEQGILRRERQDQQQGAILRRWLDGQVRPAFAGRILMVDDAIAMRCAALHVPDPRPEYDALIAATALVHGLAVVTRTVADFVPTGVAVFNPWID